MKKDYKVLVCYNEPYTLYHNYSGRSDLEVHPPDDLSETEFMRGVDIIRESLREHFTQVEFLPLRDIHDFIQDIRMSQPDVIFNFIEAVNGKAEHESYAAGIFELLEINYTGNVPLCLGNCLHKDRAKRILRAHGVNTPDHQIFFYNKRSNDVDININYPIILKIVNEDASIGISEQSVVYNIKELKKRLEFLFNSYKKDVLAEEYIDGREFNSAVLDGEPLPISEIDFDGLPDHLPGIVTYEGKWTDESVYYKHTKPVCPAKIGKRLERSLKETAVKAYHALNCRDYARVDMRINKDNVPFVIEVNPNPDVYLDSGFARAAKAAGIEYPELLYRIAEMARKREEIYDTAN